MEFWGVEVKSGEPLSVKPSDDYVIHLSQACLGEVKKDKGSESICLYVEVDGQKLVIGRLSGEKFPQISFDLVFQKEFELSHNWKNGSVHFCGYKSHLLESDGDESDEDDLEECDFPEALPIASVNNGKSESQAKPIAEKASASKPDFAAGKQKVKIVGSKKKNESDADADADDSDSDSDSDSEDQVMANAEGESDDDESEDNESSDEDEETPKKKVELSKKRPADSAPKSPAAEKKAKFVTPQKNDGKKGVVHVATPHPSKHASRATTSNEQAKQQTASSSGTISCKSCNRSFKSDQALQSHTKAKHGAAA